MSKVLFVNGNLHGHINPTLPVVQEMVRCKEEVFYFTTDEYKQKVEETGAHFMDYGQKLNDFFQSYRPSGSHPFFQLIEFMLAMDRAVVPIVLEKTKGIKFDYILHDVMFGAGNILAAKLQLPAISTCSSFVLEKLPLPPHMLQPGFHPQLDKFYQDLKEAEQEWSIGPLTVNDIFFKKEAMNLVFTSKQFQPEGDRYDTSYRFVGPSIAPRGDQADFELDNLEHRKVIYISLGTVNNRYIDFYQKCMEAFRNESYQVIMSVGFKTDIASLPQIPDNFIIRNYVPQLEVLRKADLFISHGGLNSVSEALYYGVPIIGIPIANDQPMVTRQIVNLGAGMELKLEEITPEILVTACRKILLDDSYKTNASKIGNSFEQAGGFQAAVKCILDFKSNVK